MAQDIARILRSLDVSNERHRTDDNQMQIDAYHNALVDVALAFDILPSQKFVEPKIDT